MLEDFGIDVDELREEVQHEINRWFESVDFDFVFERLMDREVIDEMATENVKLYDDIYEVIEEEVSKIFYKR